MKKFLLFALAFSIKTGLSAGVFTSVASGNYGTATTWTFTGTDADGIPDQDDDVTIAGGHTVTLQANANAKTLTINASGTLAMNTKQMLVWGNLTNNGTTSGAGTWQFRANGTYSGNGINNNGTIYFYSGYTIAAGVNVFKPGFIVVSNNCVVTNRGNITLTTSGVLNIYAGGKWINAAGSSLSVSDDVINNGTIDASAATNTFTYTTSGYTTVQGTNATYYNLNINSPSAATKTLVGTLNVRNNLTIGTNVTLNWASNNIKLGGSWTNNANTTCTNMGTITFDGSGTQTINRTATERFGGMTFANTGTVQLNRDVNCSGTVTLTSGTINPTTFFLHQKGASWLSNGGAFNTGVTGGVIFDGGINQTIGGTTGVTFGNLQINNPGFSVTCTTDQTGAGTTTLTAGIFSPGSVIFHQSGASWLANGGTINTGATGTISFNGSSAQTINGTVGAAFGNLEIASSSTVTLGRALDVDGSLSVLSGTLDISASLFDINIAGNFVHNGGTFTGRTGTVFFDGGAAQTISGSATTTFNNITSNNTLGGVSVTSIIIVNGLIQVNSRSFGTTGSGSVILTATGPTTYAKIGPLGAGASLVGTGWTIGAYIDGPATAYWQYLGSPVSGATLADWDNDNRFYMSGVGGNDGNACCPVFYSVRTYSPTTNSYTNVTSVTTTLLPARGYMVWMADNTTSLTAPLPYDTKGAPNQGTITRAVTAGGPGNGYNLVSNPYACPVDYSSVVTASGNLHPNFLILMENGSYATNSNGGVIAPNQGFMCIALSSGNIKFLETCKNTVTNPNILRNAYPENYLRITASNGINGLGGEAVVQISNDSHNGKDIASDMPFLPSPYDDATNIWTNDNDGEDLLLNALDGFQPALDIPLFVKAGTPGTQLLSFKGLNSFSAYSCAYLKDETTGEKINLKEHDTYSFEAAAAGEKHNFTLHFERDGNCPLNEQQIQQSLDASSQVFTNNGNILAKFGFEESSDVVITVLDITGQEVVAPKSYTVSNETIAIGNPGTHGIYLVRIAKGKEISTKKIYY
jgi:hypothetical protein